MFRVHLDLLCEAEVLAGRGEETAYTLGGLYACRHRFVIDKFWHDAPMCHQVPELLMRRLKRWRGKRYRKEVAALLDISTHTYRRYEEGARHPNKLAMAELERRLQANGCPDTGA